MLTAKVHRFVIQPNLVDGKVFSASNVKINGDVIFRGQTVNDDAHQTEEGPSP